VRFVMRTVAGLRRCDRRRRASRRLALAGLALAAGCSGPADATLPVGGAAFEQFWTDLDRHYPWFDHKGVNWSERRDSNRALAEAAATPEALLPLLLASAAPLRDVNIRFRSPGGVVEPSHRPDRPVNREPELWASYHAELSYHAAAPALGWGRAGDVGYLFVGGWEPAQFGTVLLDAALASLRDTRALVLDLRTNAGGDESLALALAGRFTAEPVRYGARRARSGSRHSDFGVWQDRILAPRGPWRYDGAVYLIVGAASAGSSESFIAALRVLPAVLVLGDTTAGGAGSPQSFPLLWRGRDSGWSYTVPLWQEVLLDGSVIEWNGIAPEIVVPFERASVLQGWDPVLEWAFARAGAPLR
jgi:hypothetical protein